MNSNHIRELRESRNMSQNELAGLLGVSQQTISSLERGTRDIPTDILCNIAQIFNVTTDYIIGRTDIKRDLAGEVRMNREMDENYGIVQRYMCLDGVDRQTIVSLLDRLVQAQQERKLQQEEVNKNAQDSDM